MNSSDIVENNPKELPPQAPFWDRTVTLIVVVKGKAMRSHAVGGKKEILALAHGAELVLAAWHGQHWTDVFCVSKERWEAELEIRKRR